MVGRTLFVNLLVALALASGACAGTPGTGGGQELPDLGTIQVGYIPIISFAPFYVAVEKGYFEEEGLEVELQSFLSGSLMIAPLSTGQLDVGGGEPGPALFNAVAQDLDVRAVAGLLSQPPGFGVVPLLVRTDLFEGGEVTEPAALVGRRVAINVERGMAEYLVAKALEPAGLTVDDVELVTLPFPEMPQALANQAVDAAILPHPLAARAVADGAAVVLMEGDQITDTPQNGLVYFGQRLLDPANREAGVRLLMAYLKGARDLQGEDWRGEENAGILSEYTGVPVPAIQNGAIYYIDPNGSINRSSLEDTQAYQVSRGYTETDEPLPLTEVIDSSFLDQALERLGSFEG